MTPELDRSLDAGARLIAEIPAAVALFDRDRRYVAASAAWVDAFGLDRVKLAGCRHDEVSAVGRAALEHVQRRALSGQSVDDRPAAGNRLQKTWRATLSARPHHDAAGGVAGIIVALRTADQPGSGEAGAPMADPLTRLAQRREFASRLKEVLADPDPRRRGLLVLAINLDNLRRINSLHGFAIGDQVLRIVAERLLSGTRSRLADEASAPGRGRDMVARLDAGQFGIICGLPALRPAAGSFAARLLRIVQSPIVIGGQSLRLTASIGYLASTATHATADDVLRDLDFTLQRARALGPSRVVSWEPALTTAATRNDTLAEQLREAFDNGEFLLHYQPVLRLDDNRMVGAEALLRWNHPSEGLVPSAAFVPVLEETGLIAEVGCWAVREAVRQVESWRMLYGRNIVEWVGVNLSARQLHDPSALLATLRSIHAGGFSVHRLKLEIAETVLTHRPDVADAVLAELNRLGIGFAIDDFGAGAAALDGLHRYPVDMIKIDAAFVAQIGTADGEKLLRALLEVAEMSGAAVIAEGVETLAQRDFLRSTGCGFGQGYLLAEPMDGALLGAFALTHAVNSDRPQSDISRSVTGRVMRRGA